LMHYNLLYIVISLLRVDEFFIAIWISDLCLLTTAISNFFHSSGYQLHEYW
jgi:hypothetical protein